MNDNFFQIARLQAKVLSLPGAATWRESKHALTLKVEQHCSTISSITLAVTSRVGQRHFLLDHPPFDSGLSLSVWRYARVHVPLSLKVERLYILSKQRSRFSRDRRRKVK